MTTGFKTCNNRDYDLTEVLDSQRQLSFFELNSIESRESIEFVENYF